MWWVDQPITTPTSGSSFDVRLLTLTLTLTLTLSLTIRKTDRLEIEMGNYLCNSYQTELMKLCTVWTEL